MANYRAVANGNWSSGATWGGGAVPPNGEGHNIFSNNFTVTIDQNVNVALITNASNTGTFVGGGTAAAGGGFVASLPDLTITSNFSSFNAATTRALLCSNASGNVTINGNITGRESSTYGSVAVTGLGNVTINGNVLNGNGTSTYNQIGLFISSGNVTINGNISCNSGNSASNDGVNGNPSVWVGSTGNLTVNSGTITGGDGGSFNAQSSIYSNSSGVVTLNNCIINAGSFGPAVKIASGSVYSQNGVITATNGVNAINGTVVNAYGTFVYSPNGTNPVGGARLVLGTTPTNAYSQFALNGINSNSFVRFYTSDNSTALNQAAPTDVRSGVVYGIGASQTGRLTIPARGSVALSVNYGPSMPFTATRSGTTATATLAYSYPLVVGDQITVTGASNAEWNGSYTIASVVSGISVTFTVPNTISATAGTGANMQTTGTAVLDPAAVATAVWGAASRTITGGLVDTATTLTNAPTVPTPAQIATQVRTELGTELGRIDANISSRLAPNGTLATVTNLTNAPASVTPADIWSHASRTITGGTVDTLTNAPSVPSAATIASQVRTELSVELARVDQNISSRLASSAYTAPANSDITAIKAKTDALPASPAATGDIPSANIAAIKAKTDLLNTDRLAQVSTVSTTGAQLAAALS